MSNCIVLVLEITYCLYAKWNESGSQNKVSCLYLNTVAKINNFYLKQGQDVKAWAAQLYPKYPWVSPPGRPGCRSYTASHMTTNHWQMLQLSYVLFTKLKLAERNRGQKCLLHYIVQHLLNKSSNVCRSAYYWRLHMEWHWILRC